MTADTPPGHRGTVPADLDDSPVAWSTVSTVVALLARQAMGRPRISRADILESQPPGEALAALEAVTAGVLAAVFPDDRGAHLLQALGLFAAERAVQVTGRGSR